MNQQRNFRRLSWCFVLFAIISATLVGLGQGSWYLPGLVILCSTTSLILTDTLGVFCLHRYLVYAGMILGALIAGYEWVSGMNPNRLLWVANLLVYVQIPLYFQKKEKRVYEQWGIFLLLELVVAGLVNDTVLFGILMLPVLAVGSAALMSLAEYVSYQRHSDSHPESTGLFSRLLHWLGKEQVATRKKSGLKLQASGNSSPLTHGVFGPIRWFSGIAPFTLAMLFFTVGYFYVLPRLYSGSFEGEGLGWGGSKIGFSEQISLNFIGDLLRNDSPAFRMTMTNESTGKNYRPNQPPYIRATVVHRYIDGRGQGFWQPGEPFPYSRKVDSFRDLLTPQECDKDMVQRRDFVRVSVAERSPFGATICSLPPYVQSERSTFRTCRKDWRLVDSRYESNGENPPKRRYSFLTYAFLAGQDYPVLEDQSDIYEDKQPNTLSSYGDEITRFPESLEIIRPEIDRILSLSKEPLHTKLSKALFLEDHLANSSEFEYTLSLTGQRDPGIDPIADFILNKKRGHCQYFASALALMLRSFDIPSRLVIGFRPSEYNDVGSYFQVSQNHAHVWVEAYFTLDEIRQADSLFKTSVTVPSWVTRGVWLRLDPTPPVEGSNAGGTFRVSRTQTFDAMQDFWDEMVINMDKSKQGGIFSLFGDSSQGSYAKFWQDAQTLIARLQASRFIGGFLSPDQWFSWRFLVPILGSLALLWGCYKGLQILFPSFALWTWNKRRSRNPNKLSRIEFFERLTKLLQRVGLRRPHNQTPKEFLANAQTLLGRADVELDLDRFSSAFYSKRFGEERDLDPQETASIQNALKTLELAIQNGLRKKMKSLQHS